MAPTPGRRSPAQRLPTGSTGAVAVRTAHDGSLALGPRLAIHGQG